MAKKRRILSVLIITLLLIGLASFLISLASREKDSYEWKAYKHEDLTSLFQNQKSMFDKVVKVIATNEKFWDEAREYEGSAHADIMSPNNNKIMNLFTQSGQDTLRDFFDKTKPYEISLRNKQYVTITYINKDKTDAFEFAYYYDKTAVGIYGRTDYSEWISGTKDTYKDFISMGGDWFFYCRK